MSRTALILLAALVTTVAGCEWIDSMFAQDAGEPPLPPPPVMPTPVGPDPTSLPPPTPTVPPLPPVVPVASDDGGAPEGAVAALVIDSGPAEADAGLAAVSPTPVEPTSPTTPGGTSERRPTSTSSVPAVCRQYERCCRAIGGSGGLMGLAGGCRNPSRMLTSADPERTCRQALAAVRSAVAILPNRPSACR